MPPQRIVACGGGLFDAEAGPLRDFILSLGRQPNPRLCFLPTATGDNPEAIERFYGVAAGHDCRPSHLPLFQREVGDLAAHLSAQDVVCVAGGNTANALAIWRVHGVDAALRAAWEGGTVMTGWSAGMNCWFEASVTDSFSMTRLAALDDGLGWVPGSACPHYDGEVERQPTYTRLVAEGFPSGVAADDGVGLVYEGTELVEAVSWRQDGRAFRVSAEAQAPIDVRVL